MYKNASHSLQRRAYGPDDRDRAKKKREFKKYKYVSLLKKKDTLRKKKDKLKKVKDNSRPKTPLPPNPARIVSWQAPEVGGLRGRLT